MNQFGITQIILLSVKIGVMSAGASGRLSTMVNPRIGASFVVQLHPVFVLLSILQYIVVFSSMIWLTSPYSLYVPCLTNNTYFAIKTQEGD